MGRDSNLKLNGPVGEVPSINPKLRKRARRVETPAELAAQILAGDGGALARGITLVESTLDKDREAKARLLNAILPATGKAFRLGISGVPGVGKSTFIEHYGLHVLKEHPTAKLAVLAIDPSSTRSGGSILGDKTRMVALGQHPRAFIRPTASGGTLGGVARATKEAALLAEAAGFTHVIIETVGVGQSETAVAQLVDCFLFLAMPGTGDELQGIKKGIMEMADIIAINKSEGEQRPRAARSAAEIKRALQLFSGAPFEWVPPVELVSALHSEGFSAMDQALDKYERHSRAQGWWDEKRAQQNLYWFEHMWKEGLWEWAQSEPLKAQRHELLEAMRLGKMTPFEAASQLLERLKNQR